MRNERAAYRAAIFDLDGTLMDTSRGVFHAVEETVREWHFPALSEKELRSVIGPPVERSFARLFSMSPAEAADMAAVFRSLYADRFLLEAETYPGISSLLEYLRKHGWRTGIATYKREAYTLQLVKEKGLGDWFDYCAGSAEGQTKAQIILRCVSELGCLPHEAVMVGDTLLDGEGAREAGCAFIGVTYGFGFQSKGEILTSGCLAAAGSPEELVCIFSALSWIRQEPYTAR